MRRLHRFEFLTGAEGELMVFDVESLAMLMPDEESIVYLKSAYGDRDVASLSPEAIRCLEGAGLISNNTVPRAHRDLRIDAFRVVMTEGCNFRCPECFVCSHLARLRSMTKRTARRVVQIACDLSGGMPFTFHFFGGEPLLRKELVRDTVEMAEEARTLGLIEPAYAITTNLTLIDEGMVEFFRTHHFRIGVSVDGPASVNDKFRVYRSGKGTYADVVQKYDLLADSGIDTFILITPHAGYVAELPDIFDDLVSTFRVGAVTINTPFHEHHFGWDVDGKAYAETLVEIERRAQRLGVVIDSALSPPLSAICNATPRFSPCSITGNSTMVSVAPDGRVSPCPQNWRQTVPLVDTASCHSLLPKGRPRCCNDCIARYICGGPCRLFRHLSGMQLDPARCEFMKSVPDFVAKNLDLFGGEQE